VQCSMNWVNTAALVMSFRRLTLEAPHCLQRHLVVPLLVVGLPANRGHVVELPSG